VLLNDFRHVILLGFCRRGLPLNLPSCSPAKVQMASPPRGRIDDSGQRLDKRSRERLKRPGTIADQ
jgi:hypothetical protein